MTHAAMVNPRIRFFDMLIYKLWKINDERDL